MAKHVDVTEHVNFFVVTGGPGSGKSTLIAALAAQGFATKPEAGRAIIRAQTAQGGTALPAADPAAFAEAMLAMDIRSYRDAQARGAQGQDGVVFFDRGIPDVAGYLRLSGLPVPAHLREVAAALRYNRRVFIAPPWREIFHQDEERKQDFAEAVRTAEAMRAIYSELGDELMELPCEPVQARVRFVADAAARS